MDKNNENLEAMLRSMTSEDRILLIRFLRALAAENEEREDNE